MGNFGSSFLQSFSDAAQTKIDQKHQADEALKKEKRDMYWKMAYDPRTEADGGPSTNQRTAAQDELTKLLSPDAKKGVAKFGEIFSKIHGAHSENQTATQASPTGTLQVPATPAPAISASPDNPPSGSVAAPAPVPAPVPTSPGLQSPATPVPVPNRAGLPPLMTGDERQAAQIAARTQLAKEAQTATTFKTDEQVRAHKAETKGDAEQAVTDRAARIAAIDADETFSPEDKRRGRLEAYGIPYQAGTLATVHYQDSDGAWHPAQHNSKDGTLVGMDQKPIDITTVKDIRPEPPVAQKPSGELASRMEAQEIIDNPAKHTGSELKAAKATLKSLDTRQQGAVVRIENAQNQANSQIPDDELRGLAQREIQTGSKPSFGMGQSADRKQYNRILAQEWAGNPDAAAALASYKAGSANLRQLSVLQGQIGSFEDAFKMDLQNAREASDNVPRTSARKFNNLTQLVKSNWTDDPDLAKLKVAAQTAVNQYARLVSSASGGGVSTDSARAEAFSLLDKAMAKGSFNAALDQMEIEAGNRVKGIQGQIDKQVKNLSPSPRGKESLKTPDSTKPKIKILSVQ